MSMPKRPHILLIMTDQQRTDSLGCYGNPQAHTPNLDRLAAEGVLYERCYVNNPICTPSRASLFTGKPLPGHGVYKLHDILPDDEVLFPKHLQAMGYQTALFGKLHVGAREEEAVRRHPNDGFDIYENALAPNAGLNHPGALNGSYAEWLKRTDPEFYGRFAAENRRMRNFPAHLHFSRWAAERTIDFIRNRDEARPFFCCMSLFDPHDPYNDYPPEMRKLLPGEPLPERIVPRRPEELPDGIRREQEHSYLGACASYSDAQLRQMRFGYQASVAFLDGEVGRVLRALEEEGVADETHIVFVSDHGDMLGDHGLLAKGAYFYDAAVRVPLLIKTPGSPSAGRRSAALVQPHDLAGTMMAWAGYEREEIGRLLPDFLPLTPTGADDALPAGREFAVCLYRNTGIADNKRPFDPPIHCTMIRDRTYKMTVYHELPDSERAPEGQLFHLDEDPQEQDNLWHRPDYAEVKLRLLLKLMDWMVHSDRICNGSRAGERFPEPAQWSINNAL